MKTKTKTKKKAIKSYKSLAKENMSRQSSDLMLVGFASVVIIAILGLVTVTLSSFLIVGAIDYGLYKVFYKNSIGETIRPVEALDGFKDKFGDAFLVGFIAQIIEKVPQVLRILNYISTLYTILALLGIGGFAQSEKYTDFGQGLTVIAGLFSIFTYFMLLQIAMAQYIMVRETETGALHALRKSRQMMAGYIWKYILLRLSFVLWGLLSVITFGLSNVFSKAYFIATETAFFNDVYEAFRADTIGQEVLESLEDDKEDNEIGGVYIG